MTFFSVKFASALGAIFERGVMMIHKWLFRCEQCLMVAAVTALICPSECAPNTKRAESKKQSRLKTAIELIAACPDWLSVKPQKNVEKQEREILDSLSKLSKLNTDTLRKAVEYHLRVVHQQQMETDRSPEGRLFLLNRYIFNVPKTVPLQETVDGGKFVPQGAFLKAPKKVRGTWPLTIRDGHASLIPPPYTYIKLTRAEYPALKEFDLFYRKYGRRRKLN